MTRDKWFMEKAMQQAERARSFGQLPIGAILVINCLIIGEECNAQIYYGDWAHHAENILIQNNGKDIKRARKNNLEIELYSTLEPCLQCFGSAVHNRVSKIVYACPDPVAGSTHIEPPTEWYGKKWPEIVKGPLAKESYEMFMEFMLKNPETWKNVIPAYEKIAKTL